MYIHITFSDISIDNYTTIVPPLLSGGCAAPASTAKRARIAVGMFFRKNLTHLFNLAITPFLIEKITELPFLYIHKKVQYFGVSSDVLMGKLVYTHSLTAVQSLMQIWYHYEATFFLIMAFSQTNWRFGGLTILASLLIKSLSIKERPLE